VKLLTSPLLIAHHFGGGCFTKIQKRSRLLVYLKFMPFFEKGDSPNFEKVGTK